MATNANTPTSMPLAKSAITIFITAVFETVDKKGPGRKCQCKEIVADRKPEITNYDNISYTDYDSVYNGFFNHKVLIAKNSWAYGYQATEVYTHVLGKDIFFNLPKR